MSDDPLHDWCPLDPAEHALQLEALEMACDRLDRPRGPFLDIGCGSGRVAIPIARSGRSVVGVDSDVEALHLCAQGGVETRLGNVLSDDSILAGPEGVESFAAAWCLGHTFLLFTDFDVALDLLGRVRRVVGKGGWLALDGFCEPLWREVAEGNWQEGVSEDGAWQLIWAPGENLVALRSGDAVDPEDFMIRAHDRLLRLWTRSELAHLAHQAGWGAPQADSTGALLLLEAR